MPKYYAANKWYYLTYFVLLCAMVLGMALKLFSIPVFVAFLFVELLIGMKITLYQMKKRKERKEHLKTLKDVIESGL